jgi:CelD/BcsL family acetyltransferase involved in cellulose biosynthesis
MSAELTARVLTEAAELRAISGDWADLCERCPDATPFQRPEWLLAWVEAFAPANMRVVEVRYGITLVGLAPLLIYSCGSERLLAFMGGGVSDYLNVLIEPQHAARIVAAVFEELNKDSGWTALDLTDLASCSVLHRTPLAISAIAHDSCSALLLPRTTEELLQLLSKRQRANLRNAQSRLNRAGEGHLELATAETLPEFLNDLFHLHASRWSKIGAPGVLADERIKFFHQESAPKLFSAGILRLSRLRLKGRTIAVLYALLGQSILCSTLFCYLQGFDPEFAFVSPGTQLMFWAIEEARKSGLRKFDFLRGEEAYKRHWRAQSELTYRIRLPRSDVKLVASLQNVAA